MEPGAKHNVKTLIQGGIPNMAGKVLDEKDNAQTSTFENPFKEGGDMEDKVRPGHEGSLAEKVKHEKHHEHHSFENKRGPLQRMTAATDEARAKTHEVSEKIQNTAKEAVNKAASKLGMKSKSQESSDGTFT